MSIDPANFRKQGKPTAAQVQFVWEGMSNPSARRVQDELIKRGFDISFETVARYKRNGWIEPRKMKAHRKSAEEIVKKEVQEAVGERLSTEARSILDATLAAVAHVEVDGEPKAEGEKPADKPMDPDMQRRITRASTLSSQSEANLRKLSTRTRLIASIILMEEVARRPDILILQPKDAGLMFKAVAEAESVLPIAPQSGTLPDGANGNGEASKVIEHQPHEGMGNAIADFRRKLGRE